MDRTRPYSLQIIVIVAMLFGACFFIGFAGTHALVSRSSSIRKPLAADTIMTKRMQAIQASRRAGNATYTFEVQAPYPVLGGQ